MKKYFLLLFLLNCRETSGDICLEANIGTYESCSRSSCLIRPQQVCTKTLLWYVPQGFHENTITGCYGKIYDGETTFDKLPKNSANIGFKQIECSLIRSTTKIIEE